MLKNLNPITAARFGRLLDEREGLPEGEDRPVEAGDVLTCRGLGKCVVKEVPGLSKKGRTMIVLERYV